MGASDGRYHIYQIQYDNLYFCGQYCDIDINALFGLSFVHTLFVLHQVPPLLILYVFIFRKWMDLLNNTSRTAKSPSF